MTDENERRDALMIERRRYQWYTGYNRRSEYDKNPEWTDDIDSEIEEGEGYERDTTRFFNVDNADYAWISSDVTYDLTNCL